MTRGGPLARFDRGLGSARRVPSQPPDYPWRPWFVGCRLCDERDVFEDAMSVFLGRGVAAFGAGSAGRLIKKPLRLSLRPCMCRLVKPERAVLWLSNHELQAGQSKCLTHL